MENELLTYAKRLQALASTGLAYSKDVFDIERFEEINKIAAQIMSAQFSVPVTRIGELAADAKAHPTPRVDVRGAVIENNRILLVKERNNDRWTLPGGFAEIGFSPAENVVKEIKEEACIDVQVKRIYSLRHKAKGPFLPDVRDFYKIYFLCERIGEETPTPGPETSAAEFFAIDSLPNLCTDRTVEDDIIRAFELHRDSSRQPFFD